MAGVTSQSPSAPAEPVVIRMSPMAHFAVGFLALGMLALVLSWPVWAAPLLIIPVDPVGVPSFGCAPSPIATP